MLFHGKTPIAESCCNFWSKNSNFTTLRLHHGCFLLNLHHNTQKQLIPLIKLLLFTKSKFFANFLIHFVPLSLLLKLFTPFSWTGILCTFYTSTFLLLANIIVGVFYRHTKPFNFVSNMFFSYFACGWKYERNFSARLFVTKLNHEINWSWHYKNYNFKI